MTAGRVFIGVLAVFLVGELQAGEKYQLQERVAVGDQYRVAVTMELSGHLLIKNGDKTINLKLAAKARHQFPERVLGVNDTGHPTRVARHYDEAKSEITVHKETSTRALRADRRFQVAQRMGDETVTYSPVGPLTREELELTGEHLDLLALPGLLPAEAVAIGATWTVPNPFAQALAGFEGLISQDLRCKLEEVKDDLARVSFTGDLSGISRSVEAKVHVEGHYLFDLKAGRISTLHWKQKDERDQGPVSPASKTESTTLVQRTFGAGPADTLLDGIVATAPPEPEAAHLMLLYRDPKGRLEFHHDRSWFVISQRDQTTVLRLLDRGELVAQLNVTHWPKAKPGEHLKVEELRRHIEQSPGFTIDQVLQSEDLPADDGVWIHRLSVVGQANEIKLLQNYYAVASPQGEQVVLTFTTEIPLAEKFGEKDLSIVGTVSFPPTPAKP